jgi:HEAT repeat protein
MCEDSTVAAEALFHLSRIGIHAKAAVAATVAALKSHDSGVRQYAISALGALEDQAIKAVPALIVALGDENNEVRRKAALVLGYIGKGAKRAWRNLVGALEDADVDVQTTAAMSLLVLGLPSDVVIEAVKTASAKNPNYKFDFVLRAMRASRNGKKLPGSYLDYFAS